MVGIGNHSAGTALSVRSAFSSAFADGQTLTSGHHPQSAVGAGVMDAVSPIRASFSAATRNLSRVSLTRALATATFFA